MGRGSWGGWVKRGAGGAGAGIAGNGVPSAGDCGAIIGGRVRSLTTVFLADEDGLQYAKEKTAYGADANGHGQ